MELSRVWADQKAGLSDTGSLEEFDKRLHGLPERSPIVMKTNAFTRSENEGWGSARRRHSRRRDQPGQLTDAP